MKQIQVLVLIVMVLFGGAQAFKFIASRAARNACNAYKPQSGFSAVEFAKYASDHDSRDASISELSEKVPDPLNISEQVTTVPILSRTIQRLKTIPAAFDIIDKKALKGKAMMVTKAGFAMYTCTITFENNKVIKSLGTWK